MTALARSISAALLMLAMAVPQTASAQFGISLGGKKKSADDSGCKAKGSVKRSILGSIVGTVAGNVAGRAGIPYFVPVSAFSSTLTEAIACRLDSKEQEQAAKATDEAVRMDTGGSASWISETRANVSGTSTAAPAPNLANGSTCMTVTDVIIVEGEETRVDKRMCRAPGQARYVLQA